MFDFLDNFSSNGHFFYSANEDLVKVCNAPKNGIGVYIIYILKNGKVTLSYIGSSGGIKQNGYIQIEKGGIYNTIVNEKQFGSARKKSWKQKLETENIDALDIYWYETFDRENNSIPKMVQGELLQMYFDMHGELPAWNEGF